MILDFDKLEKTTLQNFKNGDGAVTAAMHVDNAGKIMLTRIHPNSSIGVHTHDTNYEVCYILSGVGKAVYEGTEEPLHAGICHYCPKGKTHTLINTGSEDLVLFAVVPETK
ncbi:MAG TPA: cupin domain-containing protein [Methanocorpusculum sp.]|nr:cupin domain-containing protein [Methanocorpusculum sp.]